MHDRVNCELDIFPGRIFGACKSRESKPFGVEAVTVAAEVELAKHNGKVVLCRCSGFPEGETDPGWI